MFIMHNLAVRPRDAKTVVCSLVDMLSENPKGNIRNMIPEYDAEK